MSELEAGLAAMERAARAAIAYRRTVAVAPTNPVVPYREMMAAFDRAAPDTPGDPVEIIEDLIARATPGVRAETGPRFFGWVIGSSHPTGVAADSPAGT